MNEWNEMKWNEWMTESVTESVTEPVTDWLTEWMKWINEMKWMNEWMNEMEWMNEWNELIELNQLIFHLNLNQLIKFINQIWKNN